MQITHAGVKDGALLLLANNGPFAPVTTLRIECRDAGRYVAAILQAEHPTAEAARVADKYRKSAMELGGPDAVAARDYLIALE